MVLAYTIPESPDCHDFLPSLPLPPPLMGCLPFSAPLHPESPSAPLQLYICGVDSLWDCQYPAPPWSEDPQSPPPISETWTPPLPVDPAAPPWLLAPSSPPWPISTSALLGSLVPPDLPWSVIDLPSPRDSTLLALRHPSVLLALSGSSISLASHSSSDALAPPWLSGSSPAPRSPAPSAPPWPSRSFASPWLYGSLSPLWAPLPPAPPPSVVSPSSTMTPPSIASTLGPPSWLWSGSRLVAHGSSLRLLLPGSFLNQLCPGSSVCLLLQCSFPPWSPPWSSVCLKALCLPLILLPNLPPSFCILLWREVTPSRRGSSVTVSVSFDFVCLSSFVILPSFCLPFDYIGFFTCVLLNIIVWSVYLSFCLFSLSLMVNIWTSCLLSVDTFFSVSCGINTLWIFSFVRLFLQPSISMTLLKIMFFKGFRS